MSSEKYVMVAKTFAGLEDVLKEELIGIGASEVEVLIRGVKFTGSKEMLYKANFCCRTALRILLIIKEFKVKSSNDLYNGARSIEWTDYFDVTQSFSITSTVNSEAFNNSMFVSLKTKDAIVDQFRAKLGKRPSVNAENADIRVNVHASSDEVSISLDSSGESLHKRGYRIGQNEASMSEVLAAGILKIAGWKGQCDFYDPMCGSGTIPIEAALIARNIPPGIFRKSFAFEKWKDFNEDLFDSVYNADYEIPFEHTIYASDLVSVNIKIATENARNAGLKKDVQFSVADFATLKPVGETGLLIINPPYGQRMNDRAVEPIYNMIGDSLKNNFKGIQAWVFSSSEDGFKSIGLKPSTKLKLFNGAIECELRSFEMYDGSRNQSNQDFRRNFDGDRSGSRGDYRGQGRGEYRNNRTEGDYRPRQTNERSSPRRSSDNNKTGDSESRRRSHSDFNDRNSGGPQRREFKPREGSERSSSGRSYEQRGQGDGSNIHRTRNDYNGKNNDPTKSREFKPKDRAGQPSPERNIEFRKKESHDDTDHSGKDVISMVTEDPKRSFKKSGKRPRI